MGEPIEKSNEAASPERGGERLWALIGKIGAVVAVVSGVISLYYLVNPRGPSVLASCTTTNIMAYVQQAEQDVLLQIQKEAGEDGARHVRMNLPMFTSLYAVRCSVTNQGTEPAEDVTLQLPSTPVKLSGESDAKAKGTSVLLGPLPAGPTISIEAWVTQWVDDRKIFINYKGGVGKVDMGEVYFGFARRLAATWTSFGPGGFLWFASMLGMLFLLASMVVRQALGRRK